MNEPNARRPLKTRENKIARSFAKWLSQKNITPNQISILSVFFAALSGICFSYSFANRFLMLILAAVFIQCRLLCNLFDGMVAIEGGKSTKSGELFNDIPDRFADCFILIPAGYAITALESGPVLGWLAGILAVMTAYIRTLSASVGAPIDFRGPMAKQHRMATLTIAAILAAVIPRAVLGQAILMGTLIVIVLGCLITCFRRMRAAYEYLESQPDIVIDSEKS